MLKYTMIVLGILSLLIASIASPSFASLAQSQQYYEVLQAGRGTAEAISWRPDGQAFAVGGSQGTWIYDATMSLMSHLETGYSSAVAWNAFGTLIAVASAPDEVVWHSSIDLWDVAAGRADRRLVEGIFEGSPQGISWHPGENRVAACIDNMIRIWDAESGRELNTFEHDDPVRSLVWSPDGQLVAGVAYSAVYVWDVERSELLSRFDVTDGQAIAWSPDGEELALVRSSPESQRRENSLQIWSLDGGTPRIVVQAGMATSVDWSPDGRFVATGSTDPWVEVWNPENGTLVASLWRAGMTREVHAVRWQVGTSRLLTASGDNSVRLWHISPELPPLQMREADVLHGHVGEIWALDWALDGESLVTGGDDGAVRIWRLDESGDVVLLGSHGSRVNAVSWSGDGRFIGSIAAHTSPCMQVWNAQTFNQLGIWSGYCTDPTGLSGDGPQGAVAWNADTETFLFNLATPAIYRWQHNIGRGRMPVPPNLRPIPATYAFSPDSTRTAGLTYTEAVSTTITIWDTETGAVQAEIPCDGCTVVALAWSLDRRFLAGSGYFNEALTGVRIWDTANGALVRELTTTGFENVSDLSWRADGWLAGVHGSGVTLWNVLSDEAEPVAIAWPYGPRVARWSPDGTALAIAGEAGLISIYRQR